jgi:hypothetical protein
MCALLTRYSFGDDTICSRDSSPPSLGPPGRDPSGKRACEWTSDWAGVVSPQDEARYAARPASQSRHPWAGSGGLQVTTVDRPSGAADQLDRTTRAASSRPRPNGTRRLTLEHDRVGAGSMADLGYVPEQPVTQCEGTCARDCNYLISAVVTKPGSMAKERCYSYVAQIEYKPQRCQQQ